MLILDDQAIYPQRDPAGMRERIRELPRQCLDAWALAERADLPRSHRQVHQVVILGMGGSAIGGALLGGLLAYECPLPILSVGGYDLPAWVGPQTLVVGSSYSGDTEETLSAFDLAMRRGCRLVSLATGGRLAALAQQHGIPLLHFDYQSAPRAALGYSLILLLGLFHRLDLVRDYRDDLGEAVAVMEEWQRELTPEVPTTRNLAKRLAGQLVDRLPVVYGAGFLAPVARRWKGQFNENAKNWAFWEELPELHHNAVVAYGLPDRVRQQAMVLLLRSRLDHPRVKARWEVTQELLLREGVTTDTVWGRGESRLAQMLSLIHFGDYVSLYLAMLNQADPSPVPPIDYLKRRLAEMG